MLLEGAGDIIVVNKSKGRVIMKIQRISLDGFKNLNKVDISFNKITALVAVNNFGKSNVLAGIQFGLDFIRASEEERNGLMQGDGFIPINKSSLNKGFRFEVETATSINKVKYRIIYGFSFGWVKSDGDKAEISNEYLKVKVDMKGTKYTQLINRQGKQAFYKSSETGRCTTVTAIENL